MEASTALSPTAWKRQGNACSPSLACRRANGAVYEPQMQSSVCTRSSSAGSRLKLFCRRPTPLRCCSGRCSLQDRSTCARWMVGRRSPQNPLISRLTLPPETIPSCYRRMRHTEFQPHSGRHLSDIHVHTIERNVKGQFLRGHKQVSPGRPKGARDRHSRNLLTAFADDFEKHGVALIAKVREEQPAVYLKLAVDL